MQIGTKAQPNIYDCWDHVKILNDFYAYKKSLNPKFSLEVAARDSKVFKRALLSLVLAGKRTLQGEKIDPLCKVLGMKKNEVQYFKALYNFNQAKDAKASSEFLTEVLMRRPTAANIEGDRKLLLNRWYYIPLLEFIKIPGFKPNLTWIEKRFRKKVSMAEINAALKLFKELNLVTVIDNKWKVIEPALTTTQDIPSKAIQVFHQNMLDVSHQVLSELDVQQREFISVTFALNKNEISEIKEEIRNLCKKIVLNRTNESTFEDVANINIQFFLHTTNTGE